MEGPVLFARRTRTMESARSMRAVEDNPAIPSGSFQILPLWDGEGSEEGES